MSSTDPTKSTQSSTVTSIDAAIISSGIISAPRLGSGTPSDTTFLRGDNTWATITSSQWATSGSDISYMGGNVGIGIATPSTKLEVSGIIMANGFKTPVFGTGGIFGSGGIDPISIRGCGFNNLEDGYSMGDMLKIGNSLVYFSFSQGLRFTIINIGDHSVTSSTSYNTHASTTDSDNLAIAMNGLKRNQVGVLTSHDAFEGSITTNLRQAASRLGLFKLSGISTASIRHPYAAIFYGSGTGATNTQPGRQAVEVLESNDAGAPHAMISTWLTDKGFIAPGLPNALVSGDPDNSGAVVIVNNQGNVGIGTTSPGYKLDVNGGINLSTGNVLSIAGATICTASGCTTPSDSRLKKNIYPLVDTLEKIMNLQGVSYNYKDSSRFGDKHQIGFVAQEVEQIFPEAVVTDSKTGFKAVAYDHLVAPVVEAIKSLAMKVSKVEAQAETSSDLVNLLIKENHELKQRLDRLEKSHSEIVNRSPSACQK